MWAQKEKENVTFKRRFFFSFLLVERDLIIL